MKTVIALSAFVAGILAQAPSSFGVMSTHSASPVHLLPLTARGGKFFLGGPGPTSYCPEQVQPNCPNGTETLLVGGDQTLSLSVMVPGGQQVYVAPDGSLSYTAPHSAYVPEGSIRDGWYKTEGDMFGNLKFEKGLIACPAAGQGNGYQVFGQLAGLTFAPECLGFNALTVNQTGPGAWEY
ncbi:hypothetical protein GQ43DRAFT_403814 [Delitschia confertaspora ATCC 74209]|uniref:IgE-binding protein n=1 Tax=Delitschia confertaspora ATCC 74209 TaxID=1513339 RepID=A0A9P4JI16_9PLEO|nr:hypothetical protein GQ43DRAFT_403814 [Delitschia confertaspora ATCC 74209]